MIYFNYYKINIETSINRLLIMDASTYSWASIEKTAFITGYSTSRLFISIKRYFEEAKETPIKINLDQLIPTLMKKQNQQKK